FYPGKPLSVLKVIFIFVMSVGFEFERVIPVCDVMSVSFIARNRIKQRIQQPVKNEQQFELLLEVDFLMSKQADLIFFQATYPNENKKGKSSIILKNSSGCNEHNGKHAP